MNILQEPYLEKGGEKKHNSTASFFPPGPKPNLPLTHFCLAHGHTHLSLAANMLSWGETALGKKNCLQVPTQRMHWGEAWCGAQVSNSQICARLVFSP